ncbi:MAG TPA: hypothetical protein VJ870_09630 [Amycolatopsis sp.]|nr:hypothetical protein [Amycolatopsis sp.]
MERKFQTSTGEVVVSDPRRFTELSTTNWLSAQTTVQEVLGELQLRSARGPLQFRMRLRAAECIAISLGVLGLRGEVDLVTPRTRASYLVVHVLGGDCWAERDGKPLALAPDSVVILSPGESFRAAARGSAHLRVVTIQRRLVHGIFARMAGFMPTRPIRFDSAMPGDGAFWDMWSECVRYLLAKLGDGRQPRTMGFVRDVEAVFVERLLRHPCHEFHDRIQADVPAYAGDVSPRSLERAAFVGVYIRAEPCRKLPTSRYARLVGLSADELTEAFWWQEGLTPHQFRLRVLLDCIHEDAVNARPDWTSVGDIAGRWRTRPTAQFHRQYHRRFGEWPWETLRRTPVP